MSSANCEAKGGSVRCDERSNLPSRRGNFQDGQTRYSYVYKFLLSISFHTICCPWKDPSSFPTYALKERKYYQVLEKEIFKKISTLKTRFLSDEAKVFFLSFFHLRYLIHRRANRVKTHNDSFVVQDKWVGWSSRPLSWVGRMVLWSAGERRMEEGGGGGLIPFLF